MILIFLLTFSFSAAESSELEQLSVKSLWQRKVPSEVKDLIFSFLDDSRIVQKVLSIFYSANEYGDLTLYPFYLKKRAEKKARIDLSKARDFAPYYPSKNSRDCIGAEEFKTRKKFRKLYTQYFRQNFLNHYPLHILLLRAGNTQKIGPASVAIKELKQEKQEEIPDCRVKVIKVGKEERKGLIVSATLLFGENYRDKIVQHAKQFDLVILPHQLFGYRISHFINHKELDKFCNKIFSSDGHSLLSYVCGGHRNKKLVELLLKAKANPNSFDLIGNTPLHWACLYVNNNEILSVLIKAEIDINAQNNKGWTPLYTACIEMNRAPNTAALLLQAGADPSIPDLKGKRPLDVAYKTKNYEIAKLLCGIDPKSRYLQDEDYNQSLRSRDFYLGLSFYCCFFVVASALMMFQL